jgi:hypothetical protein
MTVRLLAALTSVATGGAILYGANAGSVHQDAAAPIAVNAPFSPSASPEKASALASSSREAPREREVIIPAGTVLRVRLENGVGSAFSHVEDPVRARLASPVLIDDRTVLPAGSVVLGSVTDAQRSGRVKGRGRVAVRFHSLTPAGDDTRYSISTRTWAREAPGTKKRDALTIAAPAAGGALVGGLIGGKKGTGIGAAVGGGSGTAVVLSTRGKEVTLGRGAILAVRLARPLLVRVG